MNKMQLAHQMALAYIEYSDGKTHYEDVVKFAWRYADAMQAEADKRECKERPEVLTEEWQPDWSQAPDDLVKYFAVDDGGRGGWYIAKPDLCFDHWYWSDFGERLDKYDNADNFGYTGNWQDSLRKRPQ